MFKSFKSIAGAAIILATIATASAQARQIETETPKTETVQKQTVARAQTSSVLLAGARRRLLIDRQAATNFAARFAPGGFRLRRTRSLTNRDLTFRQGVRSRT